MKFIKLNMLIKWIRSLRRRRCRDCEFFRENWLTPVNGLGLYRFGFCEEKVHDTVMVDGGVERRCRIFTKNKKKNILGSIE